MRVFSPSKMPRLLAEHQVPVPAIIKPHSDFPVIFAESGAPWLVLIRWAGLDSPTATWFLSVILNFEAKFERARGVVIPRVSSLHLLH